MCVCTVCGCTLLMSVIFCKWHRKNQHVHTSFGLTLYIQCSHLLLLYINLFAFSSFFCFFFIFYMPNHAMRCVRAVLFSLALTLFLCRSHSFKFQFTTIIQSMADKCFFVYELKSGKHTHTNKWYLFAFRTVWIKANEFKWKWNDDSMYVFSTHTEWSFQSIVWRFFSMQT